MILDSNILIYFANPGFEKLRQYLQTSTEPVCISLISKLEVLGYHKFTLVDKNALEELVGSISILPITDAIIQESHRLRQQRKRSLGDSIIAATALLHHLPTIPLISRTFRICG